jgi:hypothetical protein
MGDSHSSKPGYRPGASPPPAKAPAGGEKSPAPAAGPARKSGRIVHDERGNAIWDWVKDTARIAVDSTSRLLRRLEVPELKMEDTHNEELRIESDRDAGGGYDPYGGSTPGRTAGAANTGGARSGGAGVTRGSAPSGADRGVGPHGAGPHGAAPAGGGGYDPYGKGVTRKPTRKP